MKNHIVLRVVAKFIIPFIILFAFYVQIHGEISPGGGFQAGVIMASAFVLYCLIYGLRKTLLVISLGELRILAAIGVLIYAGTGVVSMISGAEYLNYSVLIQDPVEAQKLGIMLVEAGVGIAVFATMLMIFLLMADYMED